MTHRPMLPQDLEDLLADIRSTAEKSTPTDDHSPFAGFNPLAALADLVDSVTATLEDVGEETPAAANEASNDEPASNGPTLEPEQTIVQEGEDLVLKADMPGVPRGSIKVEIQENWLTVTADRPKVSPNVIATNALYGRVELEMPLPSAPADHQVTADYKAGVLTIRVEAAFAIPEKFTVAVD